MGGCKNANDDTASCTDGDACTTPDACVAGKCLGTIPPSSTSTWFGNGTAGWSDGKGTQAKITTAGAVLATRGALAIGKDGTLYLADTGNERIRKVAVDGTVTSLAGNGTTGWADGKGTAATFWDPTGLAVADDGTLYVADRLNQRIRKVAVDGTVTTLAGTAPDPSFGDQEALGGWNDGPGNQAQFSDPNALILLGNVIYVADTLNHRIRKVLLDGTTSTYAGTGIQSFADDANPLSACFNTPTGIAAGADGTLYIADSGNRRIRVIAPNGGAVTTLAGNGLVGNADGAAADATFMVPYGLFMNSDAQLFVADTGGHRLRRIAGGQVTTLAGSSLGYKEGLLTVAQFDAPSSIVQASAGVWYVVDALNFRVRKLLDPTVTCPPKN